MASAVAGPKCVVILFFQYRHIGSTADRYRYRQTDYSIADTDTSSGIVANAAITARVVFSRRRLQRPEVRPARSDLLR